jgi:hypothetical protein
VFSWSEKDEKEILIETGNRMKDVGWCPCNVMQLSDIQVTNFCVNIPTG